MASKSDCSPQIASTMLNKNCFDFEYMEDLITILKNSYQIQFCYFIWNNNVQIQVVSL